MRIYSAFVLGMALVVGGCASRTDYRTYRYGSYKAIKVKGNPFANANDPCAVPNGILSPFKGQDERAGNNDRNLALAACVSGGGHRSSNFATGVLLALENFDQQNLLAEIDYFSTVSGGGLAVGNYLSDLRRHLCQGGHPKDYRLYRAYTESADPAKDFVKTKMGKRLRKNLQWTFFSGFTNWKVITPAYDRGDGLERRIDNAIFRHRDRVPPLRLGDMFIPKTGDAPLDLPIMIANATVYGSAEVFPFTPNMLAYVKARSYTHRFRTHTRQPVTDYAFFFNVPLSVPVKASASFPVAFPTSNLRCDWDPGPFRSWEENGKELEQDIQKQVIALKQRVQKINQASPEQPAQDYEKAFKVLQQVPVQQKIQKIQKSKPQPLEQRPEQTIASQQTEEKHFLHLQDGGVAENVGYLTAFNMLKRQPASEARRALLVIDAYPGTDRPKWTDSKQSSPGMLDVLNKQLNAGLDASHRRLRSDIAVLCELNNTQAIVLSFAEIYDNCPQPYSPIPAVEALGLLDKKDFTNVEDKVYNACLLRELQLRVQKVGTKLTLTPEEQSLLIAAGLQVVHNYRKEIAELIRGKTSHQ